METKKYQLPKDFAEKWVKALRSGEYKPQYKPQYRHEGCYCAIGVAGVANNLPFEHDNKIIINGKDINQFLGSDLFRKVYSLNDSDKKPFSEIADWIEQNVEFI